MKQVRRLLIAFSIFIGIWVLASFMGVMFDTANASFWSTSLMWALLSSLIVMPALVAVHHASPEPSRPPTDPSKRGQEPFIQEGSDQTRTLWPEPEQNPKRSSDEETSEQHVRT